MVFEAVCKTLLWWASGANVVRFIDAKIRKRLNISCLQIFKSDPVGIQTQDLQNRNLSFNFFEDPFVYGHLRHSSKTHLRRFCADSAC